MTDEEFTAAVRRNDIMSYAISDRVASLARQNAAIRAILRDQERAQSLEHTVAMLARRCTEQARQITTLIANRHSSISATAILGAVQSHIDDEGGLTVAALADILGQHGVRP